MKNEAKLGQKSEPTGRMSVGGLLRRRRLSQGYSLHDIEIATKIRGKYLLQIEADDEQLPHDVYARGFVQTYAKYLGLDGPTVVRQFAEQRGRDDVRPAARIRPVRTRRLVWSSQLLASVAVLAGFLAVAGYLVWQFSALAAPPRLEVAQPSRDQELYGGSLTIKGNATPGADVFVNDSPILSDGNGRFSDQLALQDGVNTIRVSAKNHLGKTTVITRNILAHIPPPDVVAAIPAATFDGVGVSIGVQGRSVTITVAVDGQSVFKGTMMAGVARTFKAKQKVVVGTSDAGSTMLTVTNSVVAGKALGTLGKAGESKNNLEFTKQTNFQQ